MEVTMKKIAIAMLLLASLTAPAFAVPSMAQQDAADINPNFSYQSKDHWAVVDTVGNCAVIDTQPSSYDISGSKILGNKSGYSSLSGALQKLKSDRSACKNIISRA
jgi:hypothetical protein